MFHCITNAKTNLNTDKAVYKRFILLVQKDIHNLKLLYGDRKDSCQIHSLQIVRMAVCVLHVCLPNQNKARPDVNIIYTLTIVFLHFP